MTVCEFEDGQEVDQVLLVREREARAKRDGGRYLRILLADRTGCVPAHIWDDVAELEAVCSPGCPVWVIGRFSIHARYGPQLTVRRLRSAEPHEVNLDLLHDGPTRGAGELERDFRDLIATVHNPFLGELLNRIFDPTGQLWQRFVVAPAAKRYHEPYRHGLLEHTLYVAQGVSATAATFPQINRDIAVTGALLHDIGKLDTYGGEESAIDLTDIGKLCGEIPLGYYRVRSEIERIGDFPSDLATAVVHIILSHHGALEHGSPVVPCTREATLVHMIDNLAGKLGSFNRLEKGLAPGETWSPFDRAIGAGACFGFSDLDRSLSYSSETSTEPSTTAAI